MYTRSLVFLLFLFPAVAQAAPPTITDDRLVLELVAREPEIVTPTGLAVDERGRVWVIENHTHQRPAGYKGPPSDRVRIFSDLGPDGRARKITTFADGFTNGMSLALGNDGTLFLATRAAIYRLRDKGDGTAGERQTIVRLDTPGDYPHNGLSGLTFDGRGRLYFSLGENLGATYKVIGSDGTTLSGGGEGGSIYRCRPDGTGLVRVATGFWNTFGLTVDAFGRLFAVDNDPDSRGPCRLLHIIEGGDYGYRFRNGRKGLHPFTAWNGELPGTLPMLAGTGEAPSGIIAYESNGLPEEYRGELLTTSWGDHLIERFSLVPQGASFRAKSRVLVRGGEDFRPVAIATGPDGSVYLTDWVDKSYPVHGQGRIWRIRMKNPPEDDGLRPSGLANLGPEKLRPLLHHPKREIRAAAAEALWKKETHGQDVLLGAIRRERDERARVQALWTLAQEKGPSRASFVASVLKDPTVTVRAEAARLLGEMLPTDVALREEQGLLSLALHDPSPYVRLRALLELRTPESREAILPLLTNPDRFLAGAALEVLGRPEAVDLLKKNLATADAELRLGILLALRRSASSKGRELLPKFLGDPDPGVRRAAIQWVGEERLREHAGLLKAAAARPPVTRELFEALLAAEEFLAGAKREPTDEPGGAEYVAKVLADPSQPTAFRALALRMLRPDHPAAKPALLREFLAGSDADLRREAVRTLVLRSDKPSQTLLRDLEANGNAKAELRAAAVAGLAHSAASSPETRRLLQSLLDRPELRRDALRSLRAAASQPEVRRALLAWWDRFAASHQESPDEQRELAEQTLLALKPEKTDKRHAALTEAAGPRPTNETEWRAALEGPADPTAGERLFFHPDGPRCFACHRIDGRGGTIGPDLSTVGRSLSRDKLIDSILVPSKEVAPQFVTWTITTRTGKVFTGVIVEEGPNSTITLGDAQGKLVEIPRNDVEERRAMPGSIMPDNLPALMTRREFRDLIAYLTNRK
jgi:putative membrane-bound dehydrogenase-like protein